MLISVIVPVYGAEKYLDKCVKSILGQTGTVSGATKLINSPVDNPIDNLHKLQKQEQDINFPETKFQEQNINFPETKFQEQDINLSDTRLQEQFREINLEIIMVDDGSTDRSGEMCDEYAASDSRIRVLHKQNGGLMSAWMAGVNISKGDYFCFVDSDDWIEPDMLCKMAAELEPFEISKMKSEHIPAETSRMEAEHIPAETSRMKAEHIPAVTSRMEAEHIPVEIRRMKACSTTGENVNNNTEKSEDKQIICCNHYIDREDGTSLPQCHALKPGCYTGSELENKIFHNILGNENRTISMSRCMKLISRRLITDNIHYCDIKIKMGEDVNIMLPAILDSKRIVVMKDSFFYHYRYNNVSMVHKFDPDLGNNIDRLMAKMTQVMRDKLTNIESSEKDEQDDKETNKSHEIRRSGNDSSIVDEQLLRERLFLFMLQIKNEFRSTTVDVVRRVHSLCKDCEIRKLIMKYPIVVSDSGNRLLYWIMRKPLRLNIMLVYALFRVKNRQ